MFQVVRYFVSCASRYVLSHMIRHSSGHLVSAALPWNLTPSHRPDLLLTDPLSGTDARVVRVRTMALGPSPPPLPRRAAMATAHR